MSNHNNAQSTIFGRQILAQRILEQGLRVEEAAHAAGVSTRTAYKWLTRYRQEGPDGLYNLHPALMPLMICANRGLSNCASSDRLIVTSANLWA